MPTIRRQQQPTPAVGRRILLDLPVDINHIIYDFLHNVQQYRVTLYQPKKAHTCCSSCREVNPGRKKRKKRWSSWTLTQLSKAHRIHWHHYYYLCTQHEICMPQLADYLATFFGGEGRGESGRWRQAPVHQAFLNFMPDTIDSTSLHVMYEADRLFREFGYPPSPAKFAWIMPCATWPEQQREPLISALNQLTNSYNRGALRELFPSSGKIKELFLDWERNLWLHPTPGYLSSSPTLDPDIRNALYELWEGVSIRSINLLLLPGVYLEYDRGKKPYNSHLFWQKPPHKSYILSVRSSRFDHKRCYILEPCSFVLPEGYSLMDIGFNERELRKKKGEAVYVRLVSPKDDEFHIRLEGPDDFPYERVDEDFAMCDVDCESGDDDDNAPDIMPLDAEDGGENMSDMISLLEKDMTIPLEDLLGSEYGRTTERSLESS